MTNFISLKELKLQIPSLRVLRVVKDGFYASTCSNYFDDSEIDGWASNPETDDLYYVYRRFDERNTPGVDLNGKLSGEELKIQKRYIQEELRYKNQSKEA